MCASDGKERQSRSVEHQHRIPSLPDRGRKIECDNPGHERHAQVTPVFEGLRWNGSNDHIPDDSSGICRRKRQHQHAKEIQFALHACHRTTERKDKCAGQIEHQLEPLHRHVCWDHAMDSTARATPA